MVAILVVLSILPLGQEVPGRDRIQKELDRALVDWKVPGAALILVGADEADGVYVAGVRSLESGKKVDFQTIFPAASLSKAFTATMVSSLALKGRLEWNDPVVKWLDWYRPHDKHFAEPIRLSHLGSHTSGYPAHDLLFYRSGDTLELVVEKLLRLPRFAAPGRMYEYQTAQYYALALAAQSAARKPWRELIGTEVFHPLGIKGEIWSATEAEQIENRAHPHRLADGNRGINWKKAWTDPRENPSGGVWLAVDQWLFWLRAQAGIRSGEDKEARRDLFQAITQTQVVRVLQDKVNEDPVFQPEITNLGYGYGWVTMNYRGEQALAHGGVSDGFRAFILIFPNRKQGLVVLSNLDRTPFNHDLGYSIADLLLGKPSADWKTRLHKKQKDQEDAKSARGKMVAIKGSEWAGKPLEPEMVGRFVNPAYGELEIRESNGGVWLKIFGRSLPLKRTGKESFVFFDEVCDDPEVIFVSRGKSGSWHVGGRVTAEFTR